MDWGRLGITYIERGWEVLTGLPYETLGVMLDEAIRPNELNK